MNEAAVPAETLDTSFSLNDASVLQVAQATNIDAYPLDLGWQAGQLGVQATPPLLALWYGTLEIPLLTSPCHNRSMHCAGLSKGPHQVPSCPLIRIRVRRRTEGHDLN